MTDEARIRPPTGEGGEDDVVDRLIDALADEPDRPGEPSRRARRRRARQIKKEELSEQVNLERVERLAAAAADRGLTYEHISELDEVTEHTRRNWRNILTSVVLHLILLAIFSFVIVYRSLRSPEIVYQTAVVIQYEREPLGKDTHSPDEEEYQDEAAPPSDVEAPEVDRIHDEGELAKVVSDVVTNRFGTAREDALRRYGGTPGSEQAVRLGLQWLAQHQSSRGHWDPYMYQAKCPSRSSCPGAGVKVYGNLSIGVTGLVLLAFLGQGHTPFRGLHSDSVARGIDTLLRYQDPQGCFGGEGGLKYMYNHVLASMAMVETYGLTGEEEFRLSAEKALRFTFLAQQTRDGGWNYTKAQGRRSDTSVTGWVVLLLKSARAAGLEVPQEVWDGARSFIHTMTEPSGFVRYTTAPSSPKTAELEMSQRGMAMMAVGLASRLFLGEARTQEPIPKVAARILAEPPDVSIVDAQSVFGHDMYYWYYATLAMFQLGGSHWMNWNEHMRDDVVNLQRLDGHAAGSWDPPRSLGGREAGRVYSTAINVLNLEIYYRYLPLYVTLAAEQEAQEHPREAADFREDPDLQPYVKLLELGSLLQRLKAVQELGLLDHPLAGDLLRHVYGQEDGVNVRNSILKALALHGEEASYPIFLEALLGEDELLRETARQELPRLTGVAQQLDRDGWVRLLQAAGAGGGR